MLDFLYNYGWIIMVFVVFAVYLWWLFKRKGQEAAVTALRETVYKFMLLAEEKFGQGEGPKKFNWVADKAYLLIPPSLKLLLSKDDLRNIVQDLFDGAKDFMDDGKLNKSV